MRHKTFLYISLMSSLTILSVQKFFMIHIPWLSNACWGWLVFVAIANLIMKLIAKNKKKKRRCKVSNDTQPRQLNRSINFAETQIK